MGARVHRRAGRLPDERRRRSRRAAARADRDRRRPLLRDGPRRALGKNRTRLRRDRARARAGMRRPDAAALRASELRRRRHRRVHRADRQRRRAAAGCRGRGDLLQLPPRPRTPALAAPARSRFRPDDDDALQRGPRLPRRVRRDARRGHARRGAVASRAAAAARRRDREVRPRHVLLQRRPRGGVAGGDARAGGEPA